MAASPSLVHSPPPDLLTQHTHHPESLVLGGGENWGANAITKSRETAYGLRHILGSLGHGGVALKRASGEHSWDHSLGVHTRGSFLSVAAIWEVQEPSLLLLLSVPAPLCKLQ